MKSMKYVPAYKIQEKRAKRAKMKQALIGDVIIVGVCLAPCLPLIILHIMGIM